MTIDDIKNFIAAEKALDATKNSWTFTQWKTYCAAKINTAKTIDFVSLIPWLSGGAYKKLDLATSNANYHSAKCLLMVLTQLSIPIDLNQVEIKDLVNKLVTSNVLTAIDRTNLVNLAVHQSVRLQVEDGDLQAALNP